MPQAVGLVAVLRERRMSIHSLKIRRRLEIIVILLLMPIALLAWLFLSQSFKDIDFAQKERGGVAYLQAAWPILNALVVASNDPRTKPGDHMHNAADLGMLGKAYDQAMETGDAARDLKGALSGIGWPNTALDRDAATVKAIASARAMISKIADGSNLTLDPDLDSFYVMDIITTKLTEALDREGALIAMAAVQQKQASLNDDEKADLMIALGEYESALSGVGDSLQSAYKGNADSTVRRNLDGLAQNFSKASGAFDAQMKVVAVALRDDGQRSHIDLTPLRNLASQSTAATDAFWQAGAGDLDRLLAARSAGFSMRLWVMLGISAAVVGVALVIAVIIARGIANQLRGLRGALNDLAQGRLDTEIPKIGGRDEIGQMAEALQILRSALVKGEELNEQQKFIQRRHADERVETTHRLANEFESAIGVIIDNVSASANELEAAANTLTATAQMTQELSQSTATASESASTNVQTVAAASKELASSVSEVARKVQESSRIAGEAVEQAERTDSRIAELSQAASRIGDVVKLITSVAEQTNLLALNATIEAARAGDAGKGFAVVAHEVKALASQTAKATEEISAQITNMQTATADSVMAIKDIGATIGRISEIAGAIAASVDEQGASTRDIARSIDQAADGTAQVVLNIGNVNRGAVETGSASAQVLSSSRSLSNESNRLKLELVKFLTTVRSA
jgi:methyl-accepting chemotaxis protein